MNKKQSTSKRFSSNPKKAEASHWNNKPADSGQALPKTRSRQLTTIRSKGQITISAAIRKATHIDVGDPISVELTQDGILLRPMKLIEASQSWFWTEEWQKGEREAEEDIKKGRTKRYESSADFLKSLK